jgi:acid phosphatase type 7
MWTQDRRQFLGSSAGVVLGAFAARGALARMVADDAAPVGKGPGEGPDTLMLTWQGDPCTTMTIQWLGEASDAGASIEYGTLEATEFQVAPVQRKDYPGTEQKVFRCELTGLQPGGEYKFQIGGQTAAYRFRTMPSRITDEFRFVSGGDAGVDSHAIATNRLAALQDPNFVFIGGDLAYDNGKSPETFTKFLKNYHSTMFDSQHRLIPLISCLGNHEVQGGYNAKREQSPQYLSFFDGFYPEQTYGTLDFGDYLSLVLLDTGHITPIAGEQTAWLEQALKERQEVPHLIVANHVPAYPSHRAPEGAEGKLGTGEQQRQLWSPLFERYKVDAVLEHHDHTFKRTIPLTDGMYDRNGVVYLGDGSWGKLRVPKTPEDRPYLAKVAQAYHMTVHSLQGDTRFHMAMEDNGRIADMYATYQKRPSRRG